MSINQEDTAKEVEILKQFSLDLLSSIQLLRWVGLGLVVLYTLNLITIILPFRFLDPAWELQAIAQVVDATPLVLIGLALMFHGKQYLRSPQSQKLIKVLSWVALVLGIVMFLLIPLCLLNTSRLYNESQQKIQQSLAQRLEQIRTVQSQIQATTSTEQLVGLVQQFNAQYPNLKINTSQNPDSLKQELNVLAQRAINTVKTQSQDNLNSQSISLLQGAVKWGLGLLISGTWLISLWLTSDWARKPKAR